MIPNSKAPPAPAALLLKAKRAATKRLPTSNPGSKLTPRLVPLSPGDAVGATRYPPSARVGRTEEERSLAWAGKPTKAAISAAVHQWRVITPALQAHSRLALVATGHKMRARLLAASEYALRQDATRLVHATSRSAVR